MTISYSSKVATSSGFGCFWKLLFRWRGSIYKLVWPDLLVFTLLYYTCAIIYRFVLDPVQKKTFEKIAVHCENFTDLIPVSFVLGFYVSIVVQRWWQQYLTLPWPDSLALFISTSILGQDERSRLMRRTVMRYINLAVVITLRMISPRIKKRFPTFEHLVESGLMTQHELKIYLDVDSKAASYSKHWIPLVWAGTIVAKARKEGRIKDDFAVKTLVDEINRLRGKCGGLFDYDWISIPLVYTQVVTLAVYTFFLGTILGRQFLLVDDHTEFGLHFPLFTFLQFFFYMGWLKVAESLVNPFGEDDDDFEINWLVDRNLQVSYIIVDEMHSEHPELIQDMYWDEVLPQELPYTIASEPFRREPPQGSTAGIHIPRAEQEFVPLLEELEADSNNEENEDKRGSNQNLASHYNSQNELNRKTSVLSMIKSRLNIGQNDLRTRRPSGRFGSSMSIRKNSQSRPALYTSPSGRSINKGRISARDKQDSTIFHLSDEDLSFPHPSLGDEEAGITINVRSRNDPAKEDTSFENKVLQEDNLPSDKHIEPSLGKHHAIDITSGSPKPTIGRIPSYVPLLHPHSTEEEINNQIDFLCDSPKTPHSPIVYKSAKKAEETHIPGSHHDAPLEPILEDKIDDSQ